MVLIAPVQIPLEKPLDGSTTTIKILREERIYGGCLLLKCSSWAKWKVITRLTKTPYRLDFIIDGIAYQIAKAATLELITSDWGTVAKVQAKLNVDNTKTLLQALAEFIAQGCVFAHEVAFYQQWGVGHVFLRIGKGVIRFIG